MSEKPVTEIGAQVKTLTDIEKLCRQARRLGMRDLSPVSVGFGQIKLTEFTERTTDREPE